MEPLASIRAPAQTTSGLAREIFTSRKLEKAQSVVFMLARFQLAAKSSLRHTPDAPTAKSRSGASMDFPIFVMKGADLLPVFFNPSFT